MIKIGNVKYVLCVVFIVWIVIDKLINVNKLFDI